MNNVILIERASDLPSQIIVDKWSSADSFGPTIKRFPDSSHFVNRLVYVFQVSFALYGFR